MVVSRFDKIAVALYAPAAVSVGFTDHYLRRFPAHAVTEVIPGILAGDYGAPFDYRVLSPFLIDRFIRLTGLEPLIGFLLLRLIFIYLSLIALHVHLRLWYSPQAALSGTLAAVAFLPLTYTDSWAHPETFLDLALFTWGCTLVASHRDLLLYPLLVVAMLNRETAAFLAVLWAAYRLANDHALGTVAKASSYAAVCASVYLGVRWLRGFEHYDYLMFRENLRNLLPLPGNFDPYKRVFGYFWLILLGIPGWIAARGFRDQGVPTFFRASGATAVLLALTGVAIGRLIETRIFVPLFPLLIPIILLGIGTSLVGGAGSEVHEAQSALSRDAEGTVEP